MASLRILQVLRAPVGGLFRHVADLTRQLAARGHAIGIVADELASDALSAGRLKSLEAVAALSIHRMKMPRLIGPGDVTAPSALRSLAKRLEVDILHGHGAKGGLHARLARTGQQVAIYTPHGGVLHFSPRSPSGLLFGTIERALMGRTDTIVFESHFARGAYEKQIGVPRCPVVVVHNGVTKDEFVPVAPDADAADFVFIGELRELKGIFVLVEALAKLPSATLEMAGDGSARPELEARISALGLGDRVTLVGAQPARAMFARGRIVVVPSLAESLPYIVLEAAAAGRPVIATRVGGVSEIFGPTAADLIPAGDSGGLARALEAALQHPGLAESAALARLRHVAEHFSVEAMTDGIEAVYDRALTARRR
jgi:glycosyltransferase involved in cell wall biosynthesis